MSHSWKKRKHLYTSYPESEKRKIPLKNGRLYYILRQKLFYRYISVLRAFAACTYERNEDMAPGIRPRILPLDPWADVCKYRSSFLKPLRHPKLERHRADRKSAVREMDANLY